MAMMAALGFLACPAPLLTSALLGSGLPGPALALSTRALFLFLRFAPRPLILLMMARTIMLRLQLNRLGHVQVRAKRNLPPETGPWCQQNLKNRSFCKGGILIRQGGGLGCACSVGQTWRITAIPVGLTVIRVGLIGSREYMQRGADIAYTQSHTHRLLKVNRRGRWWAGEGNKMAVWREGERCMVAGHAQGLLVFCCMYSSVCSFALSAFFFFFL